MNDNLDLVERLAKLMQNFGLQTLEYENQNSKIHLKFPEPQMSQGHHLQPNYFQSPYPMPNMGGYANQNIDHQNHSFQASGAESTPRSTEKAKANGNAIKSPFVGTYYGAPSPGADAFLRIGQHIKKGDTLCIIEAMKIMNEIEAEQDGIIVEILVKNEEAVEFDQPLFIIQ